MHGRKNSVASAQVALKPAKKRFLADDLDLRYQVGKRRACLVLGLSRSVYYYKSVKDDRALKQRICKIAAARFRYGYLRIHTLLRREGWHVNHKRVYRVYCESGLNLRSNGQGAGFGP